MSAGIRDGVVDSLVYMSGGKSPVDIDPTVIFLIAIFFFLMWYLNRTLFQPYLEVKDARHERIEGAREAGKEMKVEADRVLEEYQTKLTNVRQQASSVRLDMKQAAKEQEQKILGETRAEVDGIIAKAHADLDAELDQAKTSLLEESKALSELIVDKVLAT